MISWFYSDKNISRANYNAKFQHTEEILHCTARVSQYLPILSIVLMSKPLICLNFIVFYLFHNQILANPKYSCSDMSPHCLRMFHCSNKENMLYIRLHLKHKNKHTHSVLF